MGGILNLTTVDRAKAYLGSNAQAVTWAPAQEAVLEQMIAAVSQSFENYCSHGFLKDTEVETRHLNTDFLWCYRWPVASITSVAVSSNGRQSGLQPLTDSSLDEIDPGGKGIDVFDQPQGTLVRYTYVGGLAEDTAGLIAAYPDLEDLCLLQLCAEWLRHNRPDRTGVDLGSTGNVQWQGEIKLLSHVEQRLDQNYVSQADIF